MLQGWLQSGDLAWKWWYFAWYELCPTLPGMNLHISTTRASTISNMATNHPNWISKSRVLLMLSPSRAPHSMKKPSRLPWNVLQIPWLFFITLNISATLPCSPHWPSKGFLLANGLLLSIWLKLYLCFNMKSKGFSVSLILIPCPNWTMQTVPIRHFGGNFLVWLCIFYVEDTTTRIHIEYVCGSKYHTVEKGWVIPDAIMADTTIYRRNVTTWRILDKFAMDSCQNWPLYWKYFQKIF